VPTTTTTAELLRRHSCERPLPAAGSLAGPFDWAKRLAARSGGTLTARWDLIQAPDHRWWDIAWLVDSRGHVVMCWWQYEVCPSCDGMGWINLYHASTDAVIGSVGCDRTHPAPPPKPVSLVKPHQCTGDPLCCPPF
jgi:hypothetical protein